MTANLIVKEPLTILARGSCYTAILFFTLTVMDRYESSSLRFLLNAVTATKIPDNIMVNVVLIDV